MIKSVKAVAEDMRRMSERVSALSRATESKTHRAAAELIELAAQLIEDDHMGRGAAVLKEDLAGRDPRDAADAAGLQMWELEGIAEGAKYPHTGTRSALADALSDNRLLDEWKHEIPAETILDTVFGMLSIMYGSYLEQYRGALCYLMTASMQYSREKGQAE